MHVGGGQAVTQGGGAPVRVLAAYASCISMPIRGLVRPLYRLCTTLRARVVSCSLSFGKQLARVCFDIACRCRFSDRCAEAVRLTPRAAELGSARSAR